MTKSERAAYIHHYLESRFPNPEVPLHHKDPYTLLIAVLLSAQCTDVRVNQVTPILFARADTPAAMVQLSVDEILSIVRPCGLGPRKAEAIWQLSKLLLEEHDGEVPANLAALEELPGVGHKTASVVMVQAFGVPAFPVDTHIHRLAQVWELTSGKNVKETEADLKACFPENLWHDVHLQFIAYGRTVCPARGCDGLRCELCQTLFPARKKPVAWKRA
jgi:endonuclease-3